MFTQLPIMVASKSPYALKYSNRQVLQTVTCSVVGPL